MGMNRYKITTSEINRYEQTIWADDLEQAYDKLYGRIDEPNETEPELVCSTEQVEEVVEVKYEQIVEEWAHTHRTNLRNLMNPNEPTICQGCDLDTDECQCEGNPEDREVYRQVYLGKAYTLDPCGKYHHPLSPNDISPNCEAYWEGLEMAAESLYACITRGEGDPTDVYLQW